MAKKHIRFMVRGYWSVTTTTVQFQNIISGKTNKLSFLTETLRKFLRNSPALTKIIGIKIQVKLDIQIGVISCSTKEIIIMVALEG